MATLYITEYRDMRSVNGGPTQAPSNAPIAKQTVAIGGAHAESAAFNGATLFVRIHTDAICSFVIGKAPVAATTDARMAANQTEYHGVQPGDKISVISNT